jgi:hypothetical protein
MNIIFNLIDICKRQEKNQTRTQIYSTCLVCRFATLSFDKTHITCFLPSTDIVDARIDQHNVARGICRFYVPHSEKVKRL